MRLRFALHGTCRNRIFHLVAIEQGKRRDARPTELLGVYNRYMKVDESKKTVEWSVDRIRYWLHVGAIPTKSVVKLLELVSSSCEPTATISDNDVFGGEYSATWSPIFTTP